MKIKEFVQNKNIWLGFGVVVSFFILYIFYNNYSRYGVLMPIINRDSVEYIDNEISSVAPSVPETFSERIYVRNAYVKAIVVDTDEAILMVKRWLRKSRGILLSEDLSKGEKKEYAYLTMRIRAVEFDNFINYLKDNGFRITSYSISQSDITVGYVNYSARIARLKETKAKLSDLLDKTKDVNQIFIIQNKILELQTEIDELVQTQNNQRKLSNMVTVNLTLETSDSSLPVLSTEDINVRAIFRNAMRSFIKFVIVILGAFIWFVVFIPAWLIVVVIYILIKRSRKKVVSKKKKK